MKFIRDIIAEKRRNVASDAQEDPGQRFPPVGDLNESSQTSHHVLDENQAPDAEESAGSVASANSETNGMDVPDKVTSDLSDTTLQTDLATEEQSKNEMYRELSSIDCFHLNDDPAEKDETESRRQKMVEKLVQPKAEEDDDEGFIPDEPSDLKFGYAVEVGAVAQDLKQIINPYTDDNDQNHDEEVAEEAQTTSHDDAVPKPQGAENDYGQAIASAISGQNAKPAPIQEETVSQPMVNTPAPAPREVAQVTGTQNAENDQASVAPDGLMPEQENAAPTPNAPVSVPQPAPGRAMGRSGRVKTRLLGFTGPDSSGSDPFAKQTKNTPPAYSNFPVGWLVVVDGPGRGAAFTLFSGVSQIGRGPDQTVRLDFGDNSISRENHAAIAYDSEQKKFYLGHGGKANLVRLNNRPVLSTEELETDHQIRIGETVLRFIGLCGQDFCWDQHEQGVLQHASNG